MCNLHLLLSLWQSEPDDALDTVAAETLEKVEVFLSLGYVRVGGTKTTAGEVDQEMTSTAARALLYNSYFSVHLDLFGARSSHSFYT